VARDGTSVPIPGEAPGADSVGAAAYFVASWLSKLGRGSTVTGVYVRAVPAGRF